VRDDFDKWWLLPIGVLGGSALIALGIFSINLLGINPINLLGIDLGSEPARDCSGARSNDYACYQQRYQDLVRDSESGVEAAFADLKDEYAKNRLVQSHCHQLTHVIGRTAVETYSDIPTAFSRGEHFCGTGYNHGVMETIVARIGPDQMLDEANTFCDSLREDEDQRYSDYHYGCAHGLGHGFMGVLNNELFEALKVCDALSDSWERDHCYGGVFMQNILATDDPDHPPKYLSADQPLYPCTDVEDRYKNRCYRYQATFVLSLHGGDLKGGLTEAFILCATAEDEGRPACYQRLGQATTKWSEQNHDTEATQNESISELCMLVEDYETRSNCFAGAVKSLSYHYNSDAQAKALCESLDADLRAACLKATEEKFTAGEEEFT